MIKLTCKSAGSGNEREVPTEREMGRGKKIKVCASFVFRESRVSYTELASKLIEVSDKSNQSRSLYIFFPGERGSLALRPCVSLCIS